jgi:hypothetical protein
MGRGTPKGSGKRRGLTCEQGQTQPQGNASQNKIKPLLKEHHFLGSRRPQANKRSPRTRAGARACESSHFHKVARP